MAVSRLALGGSGVAYGVFTDKEQAATPAGQSPGPSRYRSGHRVHYYHPILLWVAWLFGEVA